MSSNLKEFERDIDVILDEFEEDGDKETAKSELIDEVDELLDYKKESMIRGRTFV